MEEWSIQADLQIDWDRCFYCSLPGDKGQQSPQVIYGVYGFRSALPPPTSDVLLKSVKVTLFGNRAFAEVTKLRWGHTGWRWFINPVTVVLMRRERHRHLGRRRQRLEWYSCKPRKPGTIRCWRGREGFFPGAFRGHVVLPTPWFWTWASSFGEVFFSLTFHQEAWKRSPVWPFLGVKNGQNPQRLLFCYLIIILTDNWKPEPTVWGKQMLILRTGPTKSNSFGRSASGMDKCLLSGKGGHLLAFISEIIETGAWSGHMESTWEP